MTEASNKEDGGIYDWAAAVICLKRLQKAKVKGQKDQPEQEVDQDKEEGELEDGECAEIDEEAKDSKTEKGPAVEM